MTMGIDYFSLLSLSLVFSYLSLRQILQIRVIKTEQVMVILSTLAMGVVIVLEYFVLNDQINLLLFERTLRPVLGLIFAIFLTLVILLSMSEGIPKKKMKTLWRIPIIGFLAGLYFELPYVTYICAGNVALCVMICQRNIGSMRYLRVKVIPLILVVIILTFTKIENLAMLNLALLLCIVFGYSLFNLANIQGLIRIKGRL